MKYASYFTVAILLLCVSTANAEIRTEKDDFSGFSSTRSTVSYTDVPIYGGLGGHTLISFTLLSGGAGLLSLGRDNEELKIPTYMEVKIDKGIHGIDTIKADKGSKVGTGHFLLSKAHMKRIAISKSITIRIHYYNEGYDTWDVPEKLLKEWKELTGRIK